MKRTVKETRSVFVCYITSKPTQAEEEREESSNQIPPASKKRIPEEYKDLERVFQVELAATVPLDKRRIHSIDLEEGKMPPSYPIYPLAAKELVVLQEYLQTMLEKGWIRPSSSSAGAPIIFVPRKDGKLKLCVDYRGLNRITKKNRAALPLISEMLDRLSQARFFTKIDLKEAYHSTVRIKEGDEWKTAFRCKYGHFEYMVLPLGLTNVPATFHIVINENLRGLVDQICIVFLDDILIYSNTLEEHKKHVRSVLERLNQHNFFVNLDKCEFHIQKVSFLDFVISPEGVSMEIDRVQAILQWPVPRSVHDIQVFLGFTGFYRRFIKGYSKVTVPLTNLLRKSIPRTFDLDTNGLAAFTKVKFLFTRAPLLRHFDPTLPLRLETDASAFAVGAILS